MTAVVTSSELLTRSADFVEWLDNWYAGLKPLPLAEAVDDPQRAAVISVDLVNGFCYEGNLSSPRVAGIVPRVTDLFRMAYALGVRNFVLVQEWHSEHAEEFKAFPPHAIRETHESETIPELNALPFADRFVVVHKNSLHTLTGTALETWLNQHTAIDTFIVVGDCTDLCVYDLAMDLQLRANQRDLPRRVIVPETGVQTFDLPVQAAEKIGAMPHHGDLLHRIFLYMMALNKIEIVRELT